MSESLDAYRYIGYMRSRWRWIAASAAIAVALALIVSLILTRQYTATARVLIEPPAGTDLRSAMAVSPIYLESLRTYEHFADSDSMFRKAIEKYSLRDLLGARPIESMKKRVLRVEIVRNTRILEISATLPDPKKAQALAQFLAEATVELNRTTVTEGDQDLIRGIEQQERDLRAQLQKVEADWAQVLSNEPVADLQANLESAAELRANIQREALSTQLELADAAEREKRAPAEDVPDIKKETANARVRFDEMQKQLDRMARQAAEREKVLAARMAHRQSLDAQRKAAQDALTGVEARLREARGETGYRGERLKIIDPGIVPERPSSPNVSLNMMAALLLGLVLPVLFFTLELSYREQSVRSRRSFHPMKAGDD